MLCSIIYLFIFRVKLHSFYAYMPLYMLHISYLTVSISLNVYDQVNRFYVYLYSFIIIPALQQ